MVIMHKRDNYNGKISPRPAEIMNTVLSKSDWRQWRTKNILATSELPNAVTDTLSTPVQITGLVRGLIEC
jgi:hypothetical protein